MALWVGETMRKRLQLAVGPTAVLGEEVAAVAGHRAFAASSRADGRPCVVTVHLAPPAGPDPAAMQQRVKELPNMGHPALEVPLAAGEINGHAWVVEPISALPSLRDVLSAGPLPMDRGVSALRDLARALAALHRRGLTHGAISVDTVRIGDEGIRLAGLAQAHGETVRADLDAVDVVSWALLSGDLERRSLRSLSSIRRGVPPSLDALCARLHATDPRDRPQSAGAVLDALDDVPTHRDGGQLVAIVDASLRDGRPRRATVWLVVGGAIIVLLALLQSRV